MEYTDAPVTEETLSTEVPGTMECPQCGTTLPKEADHCTHCNWEREGKPETAEGAASDAVAVLLSVFPGLGHIYKGHRVMGLLLIFVATPMAVAISLLAATATAGFGLALLPLFWFGVMFHVYAIKDRVVPGVVDEGEEY